MNCFVIMPFVRDFDDVYSTIKMSVEGAGAAHQLRCFRLDEARPAGRITGRLLEEIQAATLCVADLTGLKPNVMWEVGYAMALGKPTVLLTQDEEELPFDIKDMQTLHYARGHLSETLGRPLRHVVIDTLNTLVTGEAPAAAAAPTSEALVGDLLEEVRELKNMLGQAVQTWNPASRPAPEGDDTRAGLAALEGAWVNVESGSHLYAQVIDGELVAPYCYRGNEDLHSVYYGWKRTGEYWFARYRWFRSGSAGFTFLKQEAVDLLSGAWWEDQGGNQIPTVPALRSGVSSRWVRNRTTPYPRWALAFLEEVRREGLVARLTRRDA